MACHGQTEGCATGMWFECGPGESVLVGAGWRVGGECADGLRKGRFDGRRLPRSRTGRTAELAPSGPRRSKTRRTARSRNSARAADDLSGDGSSSLLGKGGMRRASSVAGSIRRGSSLDPGSLAASAHAVAPFSASRAEVGTPRGMTSCRYRLQARQPPRPRPWTLSN